MRFFRFPRERAHPAREASLTVIKGFTGYSELAAILEESAARFSVTPGLFVGKTGRLMEGERRRVTVLFLDLVGFTGLGAVLDHELLHGLTSRVMGLLSAVVSSCGGYVDKFEGDRLMVLFGARTASENDSARAVACSLRLLSLVTELAPMMGLSARVGVAAGPVTVAPDAGGHLTAIGAPVNLASRLEEMAVPGSALVDAAVVRDCGELFLWRDEGDIKVRGLSETIHGYSPLEPNPAHQERWRGRSLSSGACMVGRERELAHLSDLWERCSPGLACPSLARITGEPGIGKSRLLHRFLAGTDDVCILHGHTDPFDQPPLHLWIGLFREYFGEDSQSRERMDNALETTARNCPNSDTARNLLQVAPVLAGLLCREWESSGGEGVEVGARNSSAIRILIDAILSSSPVIIALEDIHWIDESSLYALKLVLSGTGNLNPLLVVTTERPSELRIDHPDAASYTISLNSLPDNDILAMALHILTPYGSEGVKLDRRAGHLIISGARGNPFFAEELTLGLLDSGCIKPGPEGEWALSVPPDEIVVPSSVQAMVQTRIDRLPRRERVVLQFASVQGTLFRSDVLEASVLAHNPELDVHGSIGVLEAMGFLSRAEGGETAFRHDLVQRAAYETMLRHNRQVIHRSVAEALERLSPTDHHATAIFRHWRGACDTDRALEWAPAAMRTAEEGGQGEEAIRISDWILESTEGSTTAASFQARMSALATRQAVLFRVGRIAEATGVVEELLSKGSGNPVWEAEGLRAKAIALHESGMMDQVESLLELALSKAREAGSAELEGRILCSLANYRSDTGQLDEALELFRHSLSIREGLGDTAKTGVIFSNMANLYSRMGRYGISEEYYRRAVKVHMERGDRVSLGYALNGLAICLARSGKLVEADGFFRDALAAHTDTGNRREQAAVLTNLGTVAKIRGDYETSLDFRTRSLVIARETAAPGSTAIALLNIGNLRRLMGHPEETFAYCNEALAICEEIRDMMSACFCLSIEGLAFLDMKDPKRASELQARATAIIDEYGIKPGVVDDYHELLKRMNQLGMGPVSPVGWKE
ncbi:MAG: tetratricopeptide repeat protein [Candidatus Fermentibacteraceae bacterium]